MQVCIYLIIFCYFKNILIYRFQTIANVVKYAGMILGFIGFIYAGYKYYDSIQTKKSNQEQRTGNPIVDLVEYF